MMEEEIQRYTRRLSILRTPADPPKPKSATIKWDEKNLQRNEDEENASRQDAKAPASGRESSASGSPAAAAPVRAQEAVKQKPKEKVKKKRRS